VDHEVYPQQMIATAPVQHQQHQQHKIDGSLFFSNGIYLLLFSQISAIGT
jgi:hypothetical protein